MLLRAGKARPPLLLDAMPALVSTRAMCHHRRTTMTGLFAILYLCSSLALAMYGLRMASALGAWSGSQPTPIICGGVPGGIRQQVKQRRRRSMIELEEGWIHHSGNLTFSEYVEAL